MSDNEGPLVTQAWVCPSPGEKLTLRDIVLPPLKPTQVQINITHCGLCHTDVHMCKNDWGIADFPLVAGHEGVGTVVKVGDTVHDLKVGDVVSVGWIRDSCRTCANCLDGRENLCQEGYQGLFLGPAAGMWGKDPHNEFGGCFSKTIRIEERFAIKVPQGLPPEVAAPLMCAGATVFEPIVDFVKPGTRVAIASIGGLGTAAIRFAKLFNGHVTALSRGEAKRNKCIAIGADEYEGCLGNPDAMKQLTGKFDVIIDTCPANADISPFMDMLALNGTYVRVGIPPAKDMAFSYNWIPTITTEKKIAGSVVTGTSRMKRMLHLAADHLDAFTKEYDDEWSVEVVKFSDINKIMNCIDNATNKPHRYVFAW